MKLACAFVLAGAAVAHGDDVYQRLGFQPLVGYVKVTGDTWAHECHDSIFTGGQGGGFRINMGLSRWFSIAFTMQTAFFDLERGFFIVQDRQDPAQKSLVGCNDGVIPDSTTPAASGYQRFVLTSLSQKASFKVTDTANLYLLLGEGIYHRELGFTWRAGGKEESDVGILRYTGLALGFGMDMYVAPAVSIYFEISAHVLSDSGGYGALLLSPHAGLTYWLNLSRKK